MKLIWKKPIGSIFDPTPLEQFRHALCVYRRIASARSFKPVCQFLVRTDYFKPHLHPNGIWMGFGLPNIEPTITVSVDFRVYLVNPNILSLESSFAQKETVRLFRIVRSFTPKTADASYLVTPT